MGKKLLARTDILEYDLEALSSEFRFSLTFWNNFHDEFEPFCISRSALSNWNKKKAYRRHDDCGNQLLGIVVCDMVNKNINTDSREKKSTR